MQNLSSSENLEVVYAQVKRAQHDVLVRSLEKVTEEVEGENRGWKIKLII
jgi:hypothetical protein